MRLSLLLGLSVVLSTNRAPAGVQMAVSQYGITWTFDRPVTVGQFVNGDFYVVGRVTVTNVSHEPLLGPRIPQDETTGSPAAVDYYGGGLADGEVAA